MKINVFDNKGKSLTAWSLNEKDLGVVNTTLLAQALRVYQSNSHQKTSKVKTRGEVIGSTRKIYKQKGTGNARHGARYAPIFVGGGIAHGPKGVRPMNLVLPKKMRRAALKSALLLKLKGGEIAGIDGIAKLDGKTKSVISLFSKIADHPKKKTLIITDLKQDKLYQAASNLQSLTIMRSNLVNAYDLIRADFVVITKPAFDALVARATNQLAKPKKEDK